MFRHPKYYKELKEFGKRGDRGKPTAASPDTDQAISDSMATANDSVRSGPGPKRQASSCKRQATSFKQQASSVGTSVKQQALNVVPIVKRQAWRFAMVGQQTVDRCTLIKFYVSMTGVLDYDKVTFSSGLMKQFLMG